MAERRDIGPNISDATVEVVRTIHDRFEKWSAATMIDTAGPVEASVAIAIAAVTREHLISFGD